jgi:hypothetical protein
MAGPAFLLLGLPIAGWVVQALAAAGAFFVSYTGLTYFGDHFTQYLDDFTTVVPVGVVSGVSLLEFSGLLFAMKLFASTFSSAIAYKLAITSTKLTFGKKS